MARLLSRQHTLTATRSTPSFARFSPTPPMELQRLIKPVESDLQAVDALIRARLDSDVVLIRTLANYIINSGGKRLRPTVVLLAARACGYQGDEHALLAAIIEFIHTATLLHDDVVDVSETRRGQATANAVWGNGASVLTGDFLYSRSFQMMVELDRREVMSVLADATNRIAEGEVLQLLNAHNPDISEQAYLEVVERKTASLFAAGCRLGAVLADSSPETCRAMENFGHHLGIAFQITDDALDYDAEAAEFGKNIGDDLAEGKTTLPLIRALASNEPEHVHAVHEAIETGGGAALATVRDAIETTDAIAYTASRAEQEAHNAAAALEALPDSRYKRTLIELSQFAIQRRF